MTNHSKIVNICFGYGQLLISDGCRIPVFCNLVMRRKLEIKLKFIFSELNYPAIFNLVSGGFEILKLDDGKLIAVRGVENGYDDSEKTLLVSGKVIIPMWVISRALTINFVVFNPYAQSLSDWLMAKT